MTLYELTNTLTIQGNVEIKIFEESGEEKEVIIIHDTDDLQYEGDIYDYEDLSISYMYPHKGIGGTAWLVIELTEKEV